MLLFTKVQINKKVYMGNLCVKGLFLGCFHPWMIKCLFWGHSFWWLPCKAFVNKVNKFSIISVIGWSFQCFGEGQGVWFSFFSFWINWFPRLIVHIFKRSKTKKIIKELLWLTKELLFSRTSIQILLIWHTQQLHNTC